MGGWGVTKEEEEGCLLSFMESAHICKGLKWCCSHVLKPESVLKSQTWPQKYVLQTSDKDLWARAALRAVISDRALARPYVSPRADTPPTHPPGPRPSRPTPAPGEKCLRVYKYPHRRGSENTKWCQNKTEKWRWDTTAGKLHGCEEVGFHAQKPTFIPVRHPKCEGKEKNLQRQASADK